MVLFWCYGCFQLRLREFLISLCVEQELSHYAVFLILLGYGFDFHADGGEGDAQHFDVLPAEGYADDADKIADCQCQMS